MNARVPRARVGHDRWLVSYADFITLMFGFFVVLYAFAQAGEKKQAQVSHAIDTAFHSMGVDRNAAGTPDPDATSQSPKSADAVAEQDILAPSQIREDLDHLRLDLTHSLSGRLASHSISLEMGRDGLVISLREAGFFESGSATPKPEALPTLRFIASRLGATPYDLRIEGHTDNVPVHNAQFNSNWELSTARATSIARLFLDLKALPPDRISAAGYAEFHPIASNDTAEGRAENRRVDLVVMPRTNINFAAPGSAEPTGSWRRITDGD
jgi:chemotaxis protein MotB